jgi:hypothetical protein
MQVTMGVKSQFTKNAFSMRVASVARWNVSVFVRGQGLGHAAGDILQSLPLGELIIALGNLKFHTQPSAFWKYYVQVQ